MPLTLRIQSYRKQAPAVAVERRFDQLGGTIGRGAGNDLELPDPGKYISRNHCKVDYVDGRYTLIDLGANPSWINERPLGTGKVAMLEDGDRLMIGDYVLQVIVDADGQRAANVPVFEPSYSPELPFQAQPVVPRPAAELDYVNPNDTLSNAKILDGGAGFQHMGTPSRDDPLGLNLYGQTIPDDPAAFRGSEFDHAPAQFVPMPSAVIPPAYVAPPAPPLAAPASMSMIPDDYDPLADFLPPRVQASAPQPYQAPHYQAPAPQHYLPQTPHFQPPPPQASPYAPAPDQHGAPAMPRPAGRAPQQASAPHAGDAEIMQALLRGMGLPDLKLNRSPVETAELVGAMLREATAGTMAVLLARALTKRESRLEMTVIGAQANNPLKFFPDAESALAQMLTNAMAGYMPPMKSIGSAFEDLRAHEMAVIAGMRAALAGVLQRFNPAVIEHRMEPEGMMDKMLSASRKAKMWDKMVELYAEISREADDDFQHLFGEKFSAAYEDQIGRLNQGKR